MRPHLLAIPILLLIAPSAGNAAAQTSVRLTATQEARAEYLLDQRVPCRGCHVIGGKGGRVGPVLDGVLARRSQDYVERMVADPQAVAPGTPMPRVHMNARDRALIIQYAATRPAAAAAGGTATRQTALAGGAARYGHYCAPCHGASGKGDGPNAPNLPVKPADHADAKAMSARTDDRLFDGIFAGGVVLGKSALMPGFGHTLSREQIRELVAYIRTLCKCRQPQWADEG